MVVTNETQMTTLDEQREKGLANFPTPRFCPWCGAHVERWGHDDNCKRPEDCVLIVQRRPALTSSNRRRLVHEG